MNFGGIKLANKYIVAVDIGASSGKMNRFYYDGNKIVLDKEFEIPNNPVNIFEHTYWNILSIYGEILNGLRSFSEKQINSIGIDTFGATFGFIDKQGLLAEPVFHYRDIRAKNSLNEIYKIIDKKELFKSTGCQPNRTYSLPHIYAISKTNSDILERSKSMLFFPDLLNYFLSGETSNDIAFAGTSALLNNKLDGWNYELLNILGIPTNILGELVKPGHIKGKLIKTAQFDSNLSEETLIITSCSHDTASAVAAIPNFDEKSVYIGSGTSINMGIEADFIGLDDKYFDYGLKNTGGLYGKNLIYKDFSAFWFLNSIIDEWSKCNKYYTYDRIFKMAGSVQNNESFIDLEDDLFNNASMTMTEKINFYLKNTTQKQLNSDEEFLACIFDSIALKIKDTVEKLGVATGRKLEKIYIVNGGSRNYYLNQIIANATGKIVFAGMANASLAGNAFAQLYGMGDLENLNQIRNVSANSFEFIEYLPQNNKNWNEIKEYAQKIKIL